MLETNLLTFSQMFMFFLNLECQGKTEFKRAKNLRL